LATHLTGSHLVLISNGSRFWKTSIQLFTVLWGHWREFLNILDAFIRGRWIWHHFIRCVNSVISQGKIIYKNQTFKRTTGQLKWDSKEDGA
jgi:hypothetical protein